MDKRNLAEGTRRFRRIELCDVIGGAAASALWKKRRRPQAVSQYGYSPCRQHLHAVLALRLQLWFLRSQRRHGVAVFFDATNAFPSVAWHALDAATNISDEPDDGVLLWHRYHRAGTVIGDADGFSVILRSQQGDRQGDGPAAQRFTLAYDAVLELWCSATMSEDDLNYMSRRDPWSECWRPPVHIQMADDTARVVTAASPELLAERVHDLVHSLAAATASLSIEQNVKKLQILVSLQHCTAVLQQRLQLSLARFGLSANVTDVAIHLGCIHQSNGS
ncbi:MAG: hypothetical protein ACKPKO_30460, partial [Candidatus Fonsibacter sp.]